MRPNRLIIEAFGPYADRAEVDFDALADTRLFVVSGPTGAGKTSIFDAMCWALYGDLPGNRFREGKVRSDAADPNRLTTVELTFTVNDITYRVKRQPEQERPKVRCNGTTTEKQQVALHRREGGAWEPVSQRWSETNRVCADLLGLSAAQFQQVVLLPQGRFQEVLHAGSADRTELLRSLFDTAGFARAEDLLDQRAKAAEARRDELVAEVSRSEDTANAELDALETLIEAQGIDLPAAKPAETAVAAVDPALTDPTLTDPAPEAAVDELTVPQPAVVRSVDRNAEPKRRRRGRGRPDVPGQLSLVPDVGFEFEADEPAEAERPEPITASQPSATPVADAPALTQAPAPARPSLDDQANRLEKHGVATLKDRRDKRRTERTTAEAALNRARQLVERQTRFHADLAVLNHRADQLSNVEVNRVRLDEALRAAGVDQAHQNNERAAARLADIATATESALLGVSNHVAALAQIWPGKSPADTADQALPAWLADATSLDLAALPSSGRTQLAEQLEALAMQADGEAGDLRTRANEVAQARQLSDQAETRRDEADAAAKRVEQTDLALTELEAGQQKLQVSLESVTALAAGFDRAQAALAAATERHDARVALDNERQAQVAIDDELAAVAQQINDLASKVAQATRERDAALKMAESLADHRSDLDRASSTVKLAHKRDRTETELAEAGASVRRGAEAYDRVMAGFTANAAPRLADTLVDDEDCPVCGSTEHPRPATAPDGVEPVSSSDLEQAHQTNVAALAQHAALQVRLDECSTELGEAAAVSIDTLEARHQAIKQLVEHALAAVATAREIEQRLTKLAEQRSVLDQRDRSAHGEQSAGRQRLESLLARLGASVDTDVAELQALVITTAEEAQRCGAAVEELAELQRRDAELTQRAEALTTQRAMDANQQLTAATQANQLQAQAAAQLDAPDAAWPHAELATSCEALATAGRGAATSLGTHAIAAQHAVEADASLQVMLKRQGFVDLDSALAATLDKAARNRLDAKLTGWDRDGFALTERLVSTVEGGLSLTTPDIDALTARLAAATDDADRLTEHAVTAQNHLSRARTAISELGGRGDERAQAQADFEATHRLARMCRGHNANRVTLEAWVLAHHLREVVIAANRRLGAMSRGRFQIHVDDEASDQRAKHGLDLSISDAETGTRRPVRTLSGGQTFQASLALALGLADTIAVQRVGRDIAAMFIDEGFGGLDSDSLDTAIEVLSNLGAEGQMIGVITHVDEMKAGLPVAIEVTPLGGGRSELTQLIGGDPSQPPATASSEVA